VGQLEFGRSKLGRVVVELGEAQPERWAKLPEFGLGIALVELEEAQPGRWVELPEFGLGIALVDLAVGHFGFVVATLAADRLGLVGLAVGLLDLVALLVVGRLGQIGLVEVVDFGQEPSLSAGVGPREPLGNGPQPER